MGEILSRGGISTIVVRRLAWIRSRELERLIEMSLLSRIDRIVHDTCSPLASAV